MKKQQTIVRICAAWIFIIFLFSCNSHRDQHNILSDQEKKDGWTLLFDGTSLNGWHLFNRGNIPSAWSADSGTLVCNPHALVAASSLSNYPAFGIATRGHLALQDWTNGISFRDIKIKEL
jgi:hypothetical protein